MKTTFQFIGCAACIILLWVLMTASDPEQVKNALAVIGAITVAVLITRSVSWLDGGKE